MELIERLSKDGVGSERAMGTELCPGQRTAVDPHLRQRRLLPASHAFRRGHDDVPSSKPPTADSAGVPAHGLLKFRSARFGPDRSQRSLDGLLRQSNIPPRYTTCIGETLRVRA